MQLNKIEFGANYTPDNLLNFLREELRVTSDIELCKCLNVSPPIISKYRNKVIMINVNFLLRAHEKTGVPIKKLRELMGDTKESFFDNKG